MLKIMARNFVRFTWVMLVFAILLLSIVLTINTSSLTVNRLFSLQFSTPLLKNESVIFSQGRIFVNPKILENLPSPINYSLVYTPNSKFYDKPSESAGNRVIEYAINSQGFRDKEYSENIPNNTYRIVFLGDSFTFGQGVQRNETFEYIVERHLNSSSNISVEILNLGVQAFNTELEIFRLEDLGLKFAPHCVAVFYLFNDDEDQRRIDKYRYYIVQALYREGYSAEESMKKYEEWILTDPKLSLFTEFTSVKLARINKSFNKLNNLSVLYDFNVVLVSFPLFPESEEIFTKAIYQYNWSIYYLKDIGYTYQEPWILSEKDWHPSVFAHRQIADFLINHLKESCITE